MFYNGYCKLINNIYNHIIKVRICHYGIKLISLKNKQVKYKFVSPWPRQ